MTYQEAKTCKPGDRVIFRIGRFKGCEARITAIHPDDSIRLFWVEYEGFGRHGLTTHEKVVLNHNET